MPPKKRTTSKAKANCLTTTPNDVAKKDVTKKTRKPPTNRADPPPWSPRRIARRKLDPQSPAIDLTLSNESNEKASSSPFSVANAASALRSLVTRSGSAVGTSSVAAAASSILYGPVDDDDSGDDDDENDNKDDTDKDDKDKDDTTTNMMTTEAALLVTGTITMRPHNH